MMGFIDGLIDNFAEKVQEFTGESERRQLVSELKTRCVRFKNNVGDLIQVLNNSIEEFNIKVSELNYLRKDVVQNNIIQLSCFLGKFGKIKEIGSYCDEEEKKLVSIPEKEFDKIDSYISDVDWSQDDVFLNTFFLSPIGMKLKTRKQNIYLRNTVSELQMAIDETIKQLEMKTFNVGIDKEICQLYIDNIKFISEFIEEKIIPEIGLIEAFFQALILKDEIIAENEIENIEFKNEIIIAKDTIYEKHFYFVKNAFLFYVLSCKIYNTAILTKLLNNATTKNDILELQMFKNALEKQSKTLNCNLMVMR